MTKLCSSTIIVVLLLGAILVVASDNDDKPKISIIKSKRQASAIPTIENCRKLREECLRSCPTIRNCTEQCPTCPILTKVDPIIGNHVINRNYVVLNENGTEGEKFSVKHLSGANYTTIIRLSNVINNTNIVKVPTVVNSTNINHIKVFANSSNEGDGPFGLGMNDKSEPCCYVVHPKTCRFSTNSGGYRCHHRRHKTCGVQCRSRQIHAQTRSRCNPDFGCQRRVAYIPQPRPSYYYTNYWPYVGVRGSRHYSCAGCYDHYGYGYSSYYSRDMDCNGCYHDAFNYGPLYRRGPVFRPFYYHEPPCYFSGHCSYSGYYQSEFGHFGHELIDPVFGPIYDDDTSENDSNDTVSDWGVVLSKCKVVSGNDTVTLENCTLAKDNPFAAAPEMIQNYLPLMEYDDVYEPNYTNNEWSFKHKKRTRANTRQQSRRLKRKIKRHTIKTD